MPSIIRNHSHFILVTAILMLVMTYPTIKYILRTDVFWLPEDKCCDVFIGFWDYWYSQLIITGQADRMSTDMIFYPQGVSLTYHPMFLPYGVLINALQSVMPLSNAFSFGYLLIIYTSAIAAYVYLNWLFGDKWLALLGAVIFGLCPQIVGTQSWPIVAWLAPTPLILYGVHRGFRERRASLIILAGLFAGITVEITIYNSVCIFIALGLFILALAVSRWRERLFWRHVVLLAAAVILASAWRVIPMLQNSEQVDRASGNAVYTDLPNDLISFFVNSKHPLLGPLAEDIFQIPDKAKYSRNSYIGLLPIALICYGLFDRRGRRRILPWLGLALVFMVLSLGPTLSVNGTEFENIKLPKHLLNQLLPSVFVTYNRPNLFMSGAWLPLAVAACMGLGALLGRIPRNTRPILVLGLSVIVAFEYYIPVIDSPHPDWADYVSEHRLTFLDWLDEEEESEIRLINLPFGYHNSMKYSWFQSLGGYPQTEGAISRPPKSAYNYIRANFLTKAWHRKRPIHCDMTDKANFLSGLAQLEADGFSHIVYHRDLNGAQAISESFRDIRPAYNDPFVSIYRLNDLRDGCPEAPGIRHQFTGAYAEILGNTSILDDRHAALILFPPTTRASEHFRRYLRHFDKIDKRIVAVHSSAQGEVDLWTTASIDLENQNAAWVLTDQLGLVSDRASASFAWFSQRFKFCEHVYLDAKVAIDLYVKTEIPCAALDSSSDLEIHYRDGVRLHKAALEVNPARVRFYLAWTNNTPRHYSFSLQISDEAGQRVLQQDSVIQRELLTIFEMDISELPEGEYVVKLIVYDFETGKSQSGTLQATMETFDREFQLAVFAR